MSPAEGESQPISRVTVHVQPRASRNAVGGLDEAGRLKVWVTAPPADGAANEAVVALVAEQFHVSRNAVTVERGGTARTKVLAIRGAQISVPDSHGKRT